MGPDTVDGIFKVPSGKKSPDNQKFNISQNYPSKLKDKSRHFHINKTESVGLSQIFPTRNTSEVKDTR